MTPTPKHLFLTPNGHLAIDWDTGERRLYAVGELRRSCPCATCRGHEPDWAAPSDSSPIVPALAITGMDPVGSYGYKIRFSDGHDTGIFTLEYLRQLGTLSEG
jgi:DUF971 family protein